MSDYHKVRAKEDFDKALGRARLSGILSLLAPEKKELLSFGEIRSIIKPASESYLGMQVVSLFRIVGSEGRYNDFNKMFLPKKGHLRNRWERVDEAHHRDILLPPISLYKMGGVYFVRDGNHRVSVARMQGGTAIDAEVVELSVDLDIRPEMTKEEMIRAVVAYERKQVLERTGLDQMIDMEQIYFTALGGYEALIRHIEGHRFLIQEETSEDISFEAGARSWFSMVFLPVCGLIREQQILNDFPGRKAGDLFLWLMDHYHYLREQKEKESPGESVHLQDLSKNYVRDYGTSFFRRLRRKLFRRMRIFKKRKSEESRRNG